MKLCAPHLNRGARPKLTGELIANDIGAVINLEWGFRGLLASDAYDNFDFFRHGITEIRIRLSDFSPPSRGQVLRAINTIRYLIANDINILVHCATGVDRTGFIIAVYRMQAQGWSYERAYAEWVSEGRHIWYDWWKHELKTWEGK